jgi:Holliday junction DNA helicase RuvA
MIARLTGALLERGADHAVIDVGGVGYFVHLSAATAGALPPEGARVALRTFTNVREDAIELFGFATGDEESVFLALIEVKGVGPRAAQKLLSGISPRELATAIAQGDVARLTQAPGVGKKTAERLVVELKEKLSVFSRAAGPKETAGLSLLEQLSQALLNLGYKPAVADQTAESLRQEAGEKPLEELLRLALKRLRG